MLIVTAGANTASDMAEFLESYSINGLDSATPLGDNSCIFVKYLTSEGYGEFQSPVEYAEIFARSLFEETGI